MVTTLKVNWRQIRDRMSRNNADLDIRNRHDVT
jgi:hypothetical protein